MGRSSASANGNGRAVLPPVAPAEMTVYRQPRRRRGPLRVVLGGIVWLFALALIVSSGVAGGVYLYAEEDVAEAFAPKRVSVEVAEEKLDVTLPGKPTIALVVGYDRRHGEEGFEHRSDTIMLVRADPSGQTLSTLSFPRDLLVEIHCPGNRFVSRINHAYEACEEQGVLETVRVLTGLPIHFLVTVNFRGFQQIVAKLGGVWMDVDRRYLNTHTGPTGYAAIDLQPGYQKLHGAQALDYVRYRHTDSDHYRVARQQRFVEAFKESITTSISPTSDKLLKIVNVLANNVEIATGGGGGISVPTMLSYALLAYHLPYGHFTQSRIRPEVVSEDSLYRVIAPASEINRAVWEFTHPRVKRVRTARPAGEPKPPPAKDTTVLVLNGNGVAGAAATTSAALAQRGYRTTQPPVGEDANAPHMDYRSSIAYHRRGDRLAKAAARRLAQLVGSAEVKRLPKPLEYMANGAMVVLVVGQSFDGLEPPGGAQQRQPQPASVYTNPDASRPHVREARRQVPFPVLLPHVLEESSAPDPAGPMRVYKYAGAHKAVRLVYRTGTNEYWGIQMTNWNDAPIVREPNRRKKIGGRVYEQHYAGQDLRAVVVRHGGATYWVLNTLLNSLSNETMMAIAKGLKPAGRG